jgi:thiol-disulfide isomerase/thioredoxin
VAPKPAPETPESPFRASVPAPGFDGGVEWINTAGPIELEQLRGKFVLLDFWTYCCINCMHILPELKKLEHAYPNELVVIGVHSAKFDEEKDSKNIREAVLRYEIEHPIVNDAKHAIWNNFGVNSWPSVVLIDPDGNIVARDSGEFTFEQVDPLMRRAVAFYAAKGKLDRTPIRFDLESMRAKDTPLRFPGKVLADGPGKRLFIADSNHNRIVVAGLDGKLLDVIGSGKIGRNDGGYATASFNHPQGMFLRDKRLYVADTENHLIRLVDVDAKKVVTIAGEGHQGRNAWPGLELSGAIGGVPKRFVGRPLETAINSPWDLWIHGDDLYIAMAGPHQIWKMKLDLSEIGPFAGNGREDIVDGPHLPPVPYEQGYSSFAQPSGLSSDGTYLFVADSEGASIRAVPFDTSKRVLTVLGTSGEPGGRLFKFGDRDGDFDVALLQHPLAVAHDQGKIYVADTYNNKIKVVDAKTGSAKTVAGTGKPGLADDPPQFDEPAGLSIAEGVLYIADTNNHAIRALDPASKKVRTITIEGLTPPEKPEPKEESGPFVGANEMKVPPQSVKAADGKLTFKVALKLPAGFKINPLAPMTYRVDPSPAATAAPSTIVPRGEIGKFVKLETPATTFDFTLPASSSTGTDQIRVGLRYYYCREGKEGVCKTGSVVWVVPLAVEAKGADAVALEHTVAK